MPSITIHTDAPITLPADTAETVIWARTPGNLNITNHGPDTINIHSNTPGDTDTPLPPGNTHTHQPVTATWRTGHGREYTISTPSTANITWNLADTDADTGHAK